MKTLAGMLAVVLLTSLIGSGSQVTGGERTSALLEGSYVIVALRRASYIEGAAVTDGSVAWIGTEVSFGEPLVWVYGIVCRDWRVEPIRHAGIFLDDATLSDLTIGPLEPPEEPLPEARPLRLYCDGGRLADILRIDDRVIVIPSDTGVMNAILEKPLSAGQIRRLQARLKDMNFYPGELTGEIDEATRNAVSNYADHRGAGYVFHRAALTENLLDGLDVLDRGPAE